MKNKTIIIIVLVIVAIGITIFFVNQKKELSDNQIPSPITTSQSDTTPVVETGAPIEEIVPTAPTELINPSLPPAGYGPK